MGKGKKNRNNKGNKKDTKQPQDDAESSMQAQANSDADNGDSDMFAQPPDHDEDHIQESRQNLDVHDDDEEEEASPDALGGLPHGLANFNVSKSDTEDIGQTSGRLVSLAVIEQPAIVDVQKPKLAMSTTQVTIDKKRAVDDFIFEIREDWQGKLRDLKKTPQDLQMHEVEQRGFAVQSPDKKKKAEGPSAFFVRTNYLTMDFSAEARPDIRKGEPATQLYVYEIQGIENLDKKVATKAKKRVLIESMIQKCPLLYAQRNCFATDYQRKLVSSTDLSTWDEEKCGIAAVGDVMAKVEIDNFHAKSPNSDSTPLELKLTYTANYNYDCIYNFTAGYGNFSMPNYSNLNEAIHILVSKALMDKSGDKIVQAGPSKVYFKAGFHKLEGKPVEGARNKVAVRGYKFAHQHGMGAHLLNVNPVMSLFHQPLLVSEYVAGDYRLRADLVGVRVWLNFERTKVSDTDRSLDNTKRRIKTIAAFSPYSASSTVAYVDSDTGLEVSVYDHFRKTYGGKSKGTAESVCVNLGGTTDGDQLWYMADDLKILPYQQYSGTLTPKLTSALIKVACRHPAEHQRAVAHEFVPALGIENQLGDVVIDKLPQALRDSNISIYPAMLKAEAYCAEAPALHYSDVVEKPNLGMWKLTGQQFYSTTPFSGKAFFLVPSQGMDSEEKQSTYIRFFHKLCNDNGLSGLDDFAQLDDSNHTILDDFSEVKFTDALDKAIKQSPGLVVLILPRKNAQHQKNYALFKKLCDQRYGITSLCLSEAKIMSNFNDGILPPTINNYHMFGAYVRNVGMKLNVRLGNVNHAIQGHDQHIPGDYQGHSAFKELMILGADVVHPGKGTSHDFTPSIAAVVGSVNWTLTKYLGSSRYQEGGEEIITDMGSMVKERLQAYKTATGKLPTRILYYRDGVDEGKFLKVQQVEMAAIRAAWDRIAGIVSTKKDLKITVVVVTKRHHTRLYPDDDGNGTAPSIPNNGNCAPGTVVETAITMPYHYDFYLISHNAIKGTARPAHYIVLKDEMNFPPHGLHTLTNMLCYTYCRSTTAVSYVPAAYYADHLCERVKQYLRPLYDGEEGFGGTQNQVQSQVDAMWSADGGRAGGNPWHPNMDEVMFWM